MKNLLNSDEAPAFETLNGNGASTIILTCDHASKAIPKNLGNLGISERQRSTHIGWDIGAYVVAQALSMNLNAPLISTKFSRLVMDCNRPPFKDDSIPEIIHGTSIPGNMNLSDIELEKRFQEIFLPYHQEIDQVISVYTKAYKRISLFAVHSYTPTLKGRQRPWPIGITYQSPSPFSEHLLKELQKSIFQPIGENEPYPITPEGDYSLYEHGGKNGINSVLIEIRQDYLQNEETKRKIIALLTKILKDYDRSTKKLNMR
jgi:predicted N-formylglutamate amidohydrolase